MRAWMIAVCVSAGCGGGTVEHGDASPDQALTVGLDPTSVPDQAQSSDASIDSASPPSSDLGNPTTANGDWTKVTAGLPNQVRVVGAAPLQDKVVAFSGEGYGPATGWSSVDHGKTWTQLGQGAGSAPLTISPLNMLFDPTDADTFYVFGNFAGQSGSVFKTSDGGKTFVGDKPLDTDGTSVIEADGLSVDFSDPARQTMLVGRHEHSQAVYRSTDGGKTWGPIGTTLPAGTARSEFPLVIDSMTYLIGCSMTIPYGPGSANGTTGIYRTTNGGATWTLVASLEVFGNATVVGDAIYWSFYNGTDGGVAVSTNGGVKWTTLTTGGLNYMAAPIHLPQGGFATLNASKIVGISKDGSDPWTAFGTAASIGPVGLSYDATGKSFFTWQDDGDVLRLAAN